MATLTMEPRVRTVEPWMSVATADDEDYFEESLPDGWEEELKNDPVFMAELERRANKMDADIAAGTLVTYTTDEVFAMLKREFPDVWGD